MLWNKEKGYFETTTIRPFPTTLLSVVKRGIAMCDPMRGTCKKEKCTFAHNRVEQKEWDAILRSHRQQEGNFNPDTPQVSIEQGESLLFVAGVRTKAPLILYYHF